MQLRLKKTSFKARSVIALVQEVNPIAAMRKTASPHIAALQ
jgi:hypothetical protein